MLTLIKEKTAIIDTRLNQLVAEIDAPYRILFQAARYALFGGGKRLRPLLTLATTEALGVSSEFSLDPACALELIHTYSLIHDDLPCMDDDDFRRGRPTVHRVYPEGHAVLAGDFLLTYAFEVIANAPGLSAEQRVNLIKTISKASGAQGMVGGQVMDLEAEDKRINLDTLAIIHRCKTGALITAAFEIGGIVANASDQLMKDLVSIGKNLGQAFQIIDDVLDVTASEAKHGKISSDVTNSKATYVTLMGIEESEKEAQTLLHKALNLINSLPGDIEVLRSLATRLVDRKS